MTEACIDLRRLARRSGPWRTTGAPEASAPTRLLPRRLLAACHEAAGRRGPALPNSQGKLDPSGCTGLSSPPCHYRACESWHVGTGRNGWSRPGLVPGGAGDS